MASWKLWKKKHISFIVTIQSYIRLEEAELAAVDIL